MSSAGVGQWAISAYAHCTCVFVHEPAGNPCSALVQVGPGDVELRQPRLCQATNLAIP